MKTECVNNLKIGVSDTDFNVRVGVIEAARIIQDNMCEYYKRLGCDGMSMIPVCNAFWAIAKTKIVFNDSSKNLSWLDTCEVKTDIVKLSNLRMSLSTKICKDGDCLIEGIHEMCGVDYEKRALRTIDTIPCFPSMDIDVIGQNSIIDFEKFIEKYSDNDYVKTVKIDVNNIDLFKHTNNVEYIKIIYSLLEFDFLKNYIPLDFEIHYIKESVLGDELKVYKKLYNNVVCFWLVKSGKLCCEAKLKYKNNDK